MRLAFRILVECTPETVQLVFNGLGVLDHLIWMSVEITLLFWSVFVILAVIVCNFYEPHT